MLRTLFRFVILAAVLAVAGRYLWAWWGKQPPLRWRWLALRSEPMGQALRYRHGIATLVHDRATTPDGQGLLADVDALVSSVAELVEVRVGLGAESAQAGETDAKLRLGAAIERTDQSLEAALLRLDDLRACLLDHAADRMEEAVKDARGRFHERAEQLGYVTDAHRELREELQRLKGQG